MNVTAQNKVKETIYKSNTVKIVFEYEFKETDKPRRGWEDPETYVSSDIFVYGYSVYEKAERGHKWHDSMWSRGYESYAYYIEAPELKAAFDLLDSWHLNDMNAGTKVQTEALADLEYPNGEWYTAALAKLTAEGLHIDGEYTFGSNWLCKPLTSEDKEALLKAIEQIKTVSIQKQG